MSLKLGLERTIAPHTKSKPDNWYFGAQLVINALGTDCEIGEEKMNSGAQKMGGVAAGSRLIESLAAGSQAPRCPDNDGVTLEPKWLRTSIARFKVVWNVRGYPALRSNTVSKICGCLPRRGRILSDANAFVWHRGRHDV